MDEIVRRADLLGELIRRNDRFKELRAAEKDVESDDDAKKLVDDLNSLAQRIAEKEHKQQPIEPEDKRALAGAREAVAGNEKLKRLSRAQADFAEMMNLVNDAIRRKLTDDNAADEADS